MAKEMKHVGKMTNTGDAVAVVFRTVPGESNQALVLQTATLPDIYHDSLMKLIEQIKLKKHMNLVSLCLEILFQTEDQCYNQCRLIIDLLKLTHQT